MEMKKPVPDNRRRSPFPAQKDIAEALNISQATVALALNPKQQHRLLPETVALVQAKAKEMGYKVHHFARTLRRGRSYTMGVLFRTSYYHANRERIRYLVQEAVERGYQLIAVDPEWFSGNLGKAFEYLLSYAVEGIILCDVTPHTPPDAGEIGDWLSILRQRNIPLLSLGTTTFVLEQASVRADLALAYRQLTEHHLAQGSRRLMLLLPSREREFIHDDPGLSVLLRVQGFREAIQAAGGHLLEPLSHNRIPSLPKRKGIVGAILAPEKTNAFSNTFEMGEYIATQMIETGTLPDSILCSNDEVATGVINACYRRGVPIPRKIRVSGTDNSPLASVCIVPITSVEQPNLDLAKLSIQRLIKLIEDPSSEESAEPCQLPCRLVVRASTC